MTIANPAACRAPCSSAKTALSIVGFADRQARGRLLRSLTDKEQGQGSVP